MLNFDEARFLRIQSGAVAQAAGIRAAVKELLARGAENVFFLGTGGAAILMWPAQLLLKKGSTFPAHAEIAAEMIETGNRQLGEKSIVVIPSLSGTTKESIASLAWCKAKGARIITLVGHEGTPLHQQADYSFVNFAEDDTSCESFYLQSYLIALAIMEERGEIDFFDKVVAELEKLPEQLLDAKRSVEGRAERFAETIKDEPWHIMTGAGSTWPAAFYYGMCILEEMQWIRTRPVHASDFFHGTLELVEQGVSVILFKGEDEARPLVERAEAFCRHYTDKVHVFDTKELLPASIDPELRGLLSPIVIATVMERVSAHLEVKRDHPLTTRRYYKRTPF